MPKRTTAQLLAEALAFTGRHATETEQQAAHRRLQRNQMAATELLRLDALRLELQTQLADYKEACTKAETRADQAEGRAKLMGCAWIKAADATPQESDGEVFVRFTDGSIGTGWATYWHGASNDFARWTFPDPDEFRLVSEWAKNVPASTGMHWTENEPVRLPHSRAGRVYLAGPMTGISELNFPAFNQEAERLRAEGLQVLNPADHGIVDGADWADYLRHDIAGLASCERIHLLRGWTKSKGACLEMTIAKALGMTVTYQVDAEMEHNNAPAVPQGWAFSVSDDDDGTWLRVKSPGGREAAFSAVNGGLAHDNRRSIASRVLLELKEALAATPAPAPAQPIGRTELEIVEQTEELAAFLMDWRWGQAPESPSVKFRSTENVKAQKCWAAACHIQEMITATDVENAVAEVDDDPEPDAAPAQEVGQS